jgi:ADP-ribosyl-[dinitrogen reductase] hydrolase
MQFRTSDSHPIQISWIEFGRGWGQIGITLCPGKFQTDGISGKWKRDLNTDLEHIRRWGAKHIVTLMTDSEIDDLQVSDLPKQVKEFGMNWHHIPVEDGGTPSDISERYWSDISRTVMEALTSGEDVLVHCKGGLGRSGSFVAGLLVENGVEPYKAIGKTREARKGAIENTSQEEWVHRRAKKGELLAGAPAEVGIWSIQ